MIMNENELIARRKKEAHTKRLPPSEHGYSRNQISGVWEPKPFEGYYRNQDAQLVLVPTETSIAIDRIIANAKIQKAVMLHGGRTSEQELD